MDDLPDDVPSGAPRERYYQLRNTRFGRRLKREQAEGALQMAEGGVRQLETGKWPADTEHIVRALEQITFSLRLVLDYAKQVEDLATPKDDHLP
jgi:hypothetical protein